MSRISHRHTSNFFRYNFLIMKKTSYVYWKPILVGLCLAGLLICLLSGYALLSRSRLIPHQSFPTAIITKIPIPTYTVQVSNTAENELKPAEGNSSEISIGRYVQITGTGGVGLRMRLAPGTESAPQFIAMENEVFEVKDGPISVDDFIWWFLVAPYDKNRQGWAAGSYLAVITNP